MRRLMLNNSKPGDILYEPFLGSGTTLIAAESIGRICLALELDPLYVDVAVRRWQAFTDKRATRLADGRTFEVVAAERLSAAAQMKSSAVSHSPRREKKSQTSGPTKALSKRAKRKPVSRC
jgi:hypothetical protein